MSGWLLINCKDLLRTKGVIIKRLGWSDRFIVPASTVLEISHHYHNWSASTRVRPEKYFKLKNTNINIEPNQSNITNCSLKLIRHIQDLLILLLPCLEHKSGQLLRLNLRAINPTTMLSEIVAVLFS